MLFHAHFHHHSLSFFSFFLAAQHIKHMEKQENKASHDNNKVTRFCAGAEHHLHTKHPWLTIWPYSGKRAIAKLTSWLAQVQPIHKAQQRILSLILLWFLLLLLLLHGRKRSYIYLMPVGTFSNAFCVLTNANCDKWDFWCVCVYAFECVCVCVCVCCLMFI